MEQLMHTLWHRVYAITFRISAADNFMTPFKACFQVISSANDGEDCSCTVLRCNFECFYTSLSNSPEELPYKF